MKFEQVEVEATLKAASMPPTCSKDKKPNLREPQRREPRRRIGKFPVQIGGHKHWLCTTDDGKLQIGCHVYSFDDWREHTDAIGRKEGYSALDIEIYKLHIEHIERVSKLLWNAKKEKAAR